MEPKYTDTISGEKLYIHIGSNDSKHYFKDKRMMIRHRIDGPAVDWPNGDKVWYVHDKRHRIDGPAVDWSNGAKSWYVNGVLIFGVDRDNRLVKRMR
jgi:hypothetical protein